MQLESLPSKLDRENIVGLIEKFGWPLIEVSNFFEVRPSPDLPKLLVSGYAYDVSGVWLRPLWAKFPVETYLELGELALVMMQVAFNYTGSLSVTEFNRESKSITFSYRILIPADCMDRGTMLGHFLGAAFDTGDLKTTIASIHGKEH